MSRNTFSTDNIPHRGGNFDDVESLVRRAGSLVVPSDSLRPRVLETAREMDAERKGNQKVFGIALGLIVSGVCSLFVAKRLTDLRERSITWSEDIDREALQQASRKGISFEWALFDSFLNIRKQQASNSRTPDHADHVN